METSKSLDWTDHSGEKHRDSGETDLFRRPLENPLYFLFLIFLCYLLVDLCATYLLRGQIDDWFVPIYNFVAGFVMIAVYFKWLLPLFFLHKRRGLAVVLLLLLLLALMCIKLFVFRLVEHELILSKVFLVHEFLRVFHFLGFTSAFYIMYGNLKLKQENFEMAIKNVQLNVMHRSLQLSSHFVLNSLSVYMARIIKLSPDLAKEFHYLTSLLRYSFRDFEEPSFLMEEVKAVRNYLEIQHLRFSNLSLIAELDVPDISEALPMPKLCLLTLVENVFFHGAYTDKEHPCVIKFLLVREESTGDWVFTVTIVNKVKGFDVSPRSGFGASSVFRVMAHEFGEGFHYKVKADESTYSLLLQINYGKAIHNRPD
ncbi:histidine kinase [uncultured Algoriphagus sp.]|uniref:histidine kinase n=1 Tax=uncultured Algoriphagus sp. TaxID=417365 RepID=UPI0030EC7992|tara:strand:- start:5473 stop:6582 length:1110 start_codon:yes stop_codon:yes gene_type:complete